MLLSDLVITSNLIGRSSALDAGWNVETIRFLIDLPFDWNNTVSYAIMIYHN